MLISSLDNQKIKDIKKLQTKKYREKTNLFLVEGEHLVLEAYKAGCLETLILKDGFEYNLDVNTISVTENVLIYISELDTPQPMMGVCHKKEISNAKGNIIILDNVQDPGNLGTIIRSAVAFNFDTIVLSNDSVDVYNSKVVRASQGLLFNVNIQIGDLTEIIPELKKDGYQIYGTKVTNGNDVKSIAKNSLFAIIMGNEGNGMSDTVSELCDSFVYINMNDKCESLNVGVAASILMYELGSK
jgi:TrmH family RNA methyltransferase